MAREDEVSVSLGDSYISGEAARWQGIPASVPGPGEKLQIEKLRDLVKNGGDKIKSIALTVGGTNRDLSTIVTDTTQQYFLGAGHLVDEIAQRDDVPSDLRERARALTHHVQQTIEVVDKALNDDPAGAQTILENYPGPTPGPQS
ncbi:hypothetical protein ACF073_23425 [Streptomyces sp. NPDC015171]|uniref:hypothetical protein n=1 Tax=Streptomyces sp. NPDC015171 TaxID=3364945 RepID=UPI0036FAA7B7